MVATTVTGVLMFAVGVWIAPALGWIPARAPISVMVLNAVLTPFVVASPRFVIRVLSHRAAGPEGAAHHRVLIAGAGSAGEMIAKELRSNPQLELTPVGFVDDDRTKHGHEMCGLPVLGGTDKLVDFRERLRADELIVAMPSAPGSTVREVMRQAQAAGLKTRTIPGMFEILSGRVEISKLRPIQIEDLLRREPIRTDLDRVGDLIDGRTVLVTGAGGSIGSELCRQISALGPGRLLMLGHGENSIFNITSEITERFPGLECLPLIADVRDRVRLQRLFEEHRPSVVFHAAAHKHVPLMEINVHESITNNVLGTRNVAELAVEFGVERLVMISTDKAVRPTNVMGATKRIAEQVVQELAERHRKNFIAVRFGNVLGSRGSVVPIFLRQIEEGGPVTVTHPEMRRYFMTIPESVQLVLQAAVLGSGGEVFVLDMGESVKIADLASDLIRLSGLEPGRDITIQYTGVRPGEKLYEELFFGREQAMPTNHEKVLRARHGELPAGLSAMVTSLVDAAEMGLGNDELRKLVVQLVPDYRPENSPHNIAALRERHPADSVRAPRSPDVSDR
jgi:FlaA1/EpsC-like NDP-sugar epimerase